ncbi:MAG: hypothetical protein ABI860_00745 [Gemmatimonadales bacterium]
MLAALVAAGTALAGWWIVPLIVALWVLVLPRHRSELSSCVLGAALGWAILLGWAGFEGPVALAARQTAGVFDLPAWVLLVATLLFPALLAGLAARAVQPTSLR